MNKFKDSLPKILQNQIEYFQRGEHDKVWATGCCVRTEQTFRDTMQQQEKDIRSLEKKNIELRSQVVHLNDDLNDYRDSYKSDKNLKKDYDEIKLTNAKLFQENKILHGVEPLLINLLNNQLEEYDYRVVDTINTGG